ncbi:hypothetical protein [Haloplanus natans]|uniref:hypothetical protein n=1 Tax=Haloplanus natans TaxID=376171 RepID=UPI000677A97B|nr:hypothetical protein [Haloplanus natans]
MHMLIRVLVPAADAIEAVGTARFALDRLIGIGEGASTAFDYYKTLDESTARYRDHPRYGGLDPAHRLSSATGKQLLDDAIEAQATWFVETVATLREKLDRLEPAEVMDDVDLVRYDCYRLGQFAGPSVWIYDEHGTGLRSRNAVDRYIEDRDSDSLWVVPADVHY